MVEFVELEEAKARGGLRMVYVSGVPSPWSEAVKGLLYVKKVPHVAVRLVPGENPVTEWTGQQSAPVAMYEDEAPRGGSAEIVLLAERLAPEPALIPSDPGDRALMFGLIHEIAGEMGLGWCRRLAGIDAGLRGEGGFPKPVAGYLAAKYGWREGMGREAQARVIEVLGLLAGRLADQKARGRRTYIGDELTALDIYSAAFAALFQPLPPEQCPMPDAMRAAFESVDIQTAAALDPILLEHRDFVYAEHLELPLTL
ncbi:MAG: hypothetical protein ACQGVK_17320 [Myxococcota bacterium]